MLLVGVTGAENGTVFGAQERVLLYMSTARLFSRVSSIRIHSQQLLSMAYSFPGERR